jgi:hypothetical protein
LSVAAVAGGERRCLLGTDTMDKMLNAENGNTTINR